MEPQMRFARTPDGMNLAYFTLGDGIPLVKMPAPFEHIQLLARGRDDALIGALSHEVRYIAYDARGFGLSTRDVPSFSMETALCDLNTIVEALELPRIVLFGGNASGQIAVRYAVEHPDRVSHLVLMDTALKMPDLWPRRLRSLHPMLSAAPDLYFQTLADLMYGRRTSESDELAAMFAQACDPLTGKRALESMEHYDVTDIAPAVDAPTLIVRGVLSISPVEASITLAAAIPRSEFVELQSASASDLMTSVSAEVLRFLRQDGAIGGTDRASPPARSSLATVLFTDIVGHTAMMQRFGDARGRDVLREHERITRDTLRAHGGAEVKTMGDGFMASFGSVAGAVDCAIALQRAFTEPVTGDESVRIRVGLNAGEPIEEDGDLFGATVILASRVCARADAGEILIPEPVRHLLAGKSYVYTDRGEALLKGFEDAVRLYEVRWHE